MTNSSAAGGRRNHGCYPMASCPTPPSRYEPPNSPIRFSPSRNARNQRLSSHLIKALQQAHNPALDLLLLQGATGAVHPHGLDTGRHHGGNADGPGSGDEGAPGGHRGRADGGGGARRAEESCAEHVGGSGCASGGKDVRGVRSAQLGGRDKGRLMGWRLDC